MQTMTRVIRHAYVMAFTELFCRVSVYSFPQADKKKSTPNLTTAFLLRDSLRLIARAVL